MNHHGHRPSLAADPPLHGCLGKRDKDVWCQNYIWLSFVREVIHIYSHFPTASVLCLYVPTEPFDHSVGLYIQKQKHLVSPLLPYALSNPIFIYQQVDINSGCGSVHACHCVFFLVRVCSCVCECRVKCMCMNQYVCMTESLSFPLSSTSKGINPLATDAGVCILSVGPTSGMNIGWKDR